MISDWLRLHCEKEDSLMKETKKDADTADRQAANSLGTTTESQILSAFFGLQTPLCHIKKINHKCPMQL